MFHLREHRAREEFWEGVRDQSSVAMGIGAWALMTGVAMVQSGLSVLEAVLMTLIVYAGSAQLAAVPMITAGAPMWVILAAAFCVNLRFVVFSAHLRPYVMHLPRWQRLVTGYVTGDLSYVFFARRFPHVGATPDELARQQAYLMGNCAVNYVAWMSMSMLGIALANAIPLAWGLGFAGILALLGVLCSLASSKLRVVSAGVAGAAAVAAWALPLKLNILVAIASAVAICLVLEKLRPHEPGTGASHA
ncbi:AzlC family ABC transporter permease [Hydrogenophaga sp. IBVHS1]|uniref:AzlC family ABC transporter permease n=1 Tax=Hydrogenophaga sp. IBVHS1 TaxID=1985169 RepID=UPI000A2E725A|nr:AzlC family ABC transporter permease [Hydrogenophaga sp. IBVHS1]OSZ71302.1 branched-chain amino acid ABC transporter permease [Hydrogenophaga sp. IBVHS1]